MHQQLRLPRSPRSPARARAFVAEQAALYGIDADPNTLLLLTSELVTNAVMYGEGDRLTLHVKRQGDHLRVEVEDHSEELPEPRAAGAMDEHGRGLALVAKLAQDWGAHVIRTGPSLTKVVWFVVGRGGRPSATGAATGVPASG